MKQNLFFKLNWFSISLLKQETTFLSEKNRQTRSFLWRDRLPYRKAEINGQTDRCGENRYRKDKTSHVYYVPFFVAKIGFGSNEHEARLVASFHGKYDNVKYASRLEARSSELESTFNKCLCLHIRYLFWFFQAETKR